MKKRVGGAIILVAVGIGIWLNSLFTGIGPGGDDSGVGRNDEVNVSLENAEVPTNVNPTDSTSDTSAEATIPAGAVPTILIDDRQYLLQVGSGAEENFQPIALDQVVSLAQAAQPGEDGIRLHIKRRETSRASTESALTDALRQAGVSDNAVQHHAGFVE
ncbi:MAG: hypothetical protein KDA93_17965 [Planctomycetaceae bacterium]|nr:hypothetical protein [Planctomycetaceae bacterium]